MTDAVLPTREAIEAQIAGLLSTIDMQPRLHHPATMLPMAKQVLDLIAAGGWLPPESLEPAGTLFMRAAAPGADHPTGAEYVTYSGDDCVPFLAPFHREIRRVPVFRKTARE